MTLVSAALGGLLVLVAVLGIDAARDGDGWTALFYGYGVGVAVMLIARIIDLERDEWVDDTDES